MTPECAVMDTNVDGSVANSSFSARRARTASCFCVSSYTGSQSGSCSVNEGSKSNPAEGVSYWYRKSNCKTRRVMLKAVFEDSRYVSAIRLLLLRSSHVCSPIVSRHISLIWPSVPWQRCQLTTGRTPLFSTMSFHVISSVLALRRIGDE